MRTDNRNVKNTIITIYFVLLMTTILLAAVFEFYGVFSENFIYVFFILLILVIIVHFISKYFEYDSDGSKLTITNRGLILTDFINYRQKKVEFAKSKLVDYAIRNYVIYKVLVVFIENSQGRLYKERFNISLLKRKKVRHVKQSLKRIIKENLKHNQE